MDSSKQKSKGYGFIRFSKYEAQLRALATQHTIEGRYCDVKIPESRQYAQHEANRKIFVGHLTEDISEEDLKDYFTQFGEVISAGIPRPFRGFAFITFLDPDVAQSLFDDDHVLKNIHLRLGNATPKQDNKRGSSGNQNQGRNDNSRRNRGGDYNNSSWGGNNGNNWGRNSESNNRNGGGDMPNMASLGNSLGINPSGYNNTQSNMGGGNPNNVNMPQLTPALVAAALSQAGWGILNNLQNPQQNMGNNQTPMDQSQSGGHWGNQSGGNAVGGSGGGGGNSGGWKNDRD